MYYMGFTYTEAYRIPIWQRRWFVERIRKEFKQGEQENVNVSRAAHDNTPEHQMLMGRSRTDAPTRLRRFT